MGVSFREFSPKLEFPVLLPKMEIDGGGLPIFITAVVILDTLISFVPNEASTWLLFV